MVRTIEEKARHWIQVACLSVLLIVPCFWHKHIQAGDLASHVYNAWLVDLIHQGQVHDLFVAAQTNNILFDFLLYEVGRGVGFENAEKLVVPLCVLVFFWGAFALLARASGRLPWLLTPAIAMVAYGFTFEMGFINFYLSVGLAFVALALWWRVTRRVQMVAAAVVSGLVYLAHPLGFLLLIGMGVYVKLSQILPGRWKVAPFASGAAVLLLIHRYLLRYPTAGWAGSSFWFLNGFDQLLLHGPAYGYVLLLMEVATVAAVAQGWSERSKTGGFSIAGGLWLLLLVCAGLIPAAVKLPQFPSAVSFLNVRVTCVTATLVLLAVGCLRPRRWHLAVFGGCALAFFGLLWRDTGRLDRLEGQAQGLLRRLPRGSRVVATLGPLPGSRLRYALHMIDRACLGYCFTYSNYEPSTGQFWIHSRPGSRTAASAVTDSELLQQGQYQVRAVDLPLYQIYQCQAQDLDRLCVRPLRAGELNCAHCSNPDSGM